MKGRSDMGSQREVSSKSVRGEARKGIWRGIIRKGDRESMDGSVNVGLLNSNKY